MKLEKISVIYKKRRSFFRSDEFIALDNISFDVKKGETLGIIGGNGAGKSTLLRVLAGIYSVDKGRVLNKCEHVSLLSLALGFDPELSGRDNAIIGGMFLGSRKQDVLESLDDIISFSELGERINEPLKTYSTGMYARLGFSVAITMQTELMLVDEVLGVGDLSFQKKAVGALVNRINSDQTVILVSHSMEHIRNLCQRVVWLENGAVKDIGNPDQILDEYISASAHEESTLRMD